jgi:hypothetical protein
MEMAVNEPRHGEKAVGFNDFVSAFGGSGTDTWSDPNDQAILDQDVGAWELGITIVEGQYTGIVNDDTHGDFNRVCLWRFSGGAVLHQLQPGLGIKRITQRVAQQIKRHDQDGDREPGQSRDVRRDKNIASPLARHDAPFGGRRLNTKAEKAQSSGGNHDPSDDSATVDHGGCDDVWQHFYEEDFQIRRRCRTRGLDISTFAFLARIKLVDAGPRSPQPGAPLTYVTTGEFLTLFGLGTLRDLPNIEQVEQMSVSNRPSIDLLELAPLFGTGVSESLDHDGKIEEFDVTAPFYIGEAESDRRQ